MSVYPLFQLVCDISEDCDEANGSAPTAAETRAWARTEGWGRIQRNGRYLDVCPRHSTELKGNKA